MITIYHNPRCSKSRQTLALIEQAGVKPTVVLYLEEPLSSDDIALLLTKLDINASELVRKQEDEYKQAQLHLSTPSEQELLIAMSQYPKLIERPIVVKGEKAIIGRPPENVLSLL